MREKNKGVSIAGIIVAVCVIVIFIIIAIAMLRTPNQNNGIDKKENTQQNTNTLIDSNTINTLENGIEEFNNIPQPKEPTEDNPTNNIPTPTEKQNDTVNGSNPTR